MLLDVCAVVHLLTTVCPEQIRMGSSRLTLIAAGEESPLPYQVDVRPSQEFSYEGAKTKLINLEPTLAGNGGTSFLVPGDAFTYEEEQDHQNFGSTKRQGKLLRLSSWIAFENRVGVGCVGAVITHLQRRRAADYLPDDPDAQWAFRVRNLEMLTLRNTM
jgi:DNA mismatch repair protein MSH5